jgi:hypothetical protein
MNKWTKWLPIVAVLSVVVVGSLFGCAPQVEPPAPTPTPTPSPQPTPTPPTPAPPAVTGSPDLELVDLWIDQDVVYYKVKNLGTAKSVGGISRMYVDGQEKADDYLQDVEPGAEEIAIFHRYEFWSAGGESIMYPQSGPLSFQVRVCIDTDDANKETNENNNCISKIIGMPYKYDFELYATSAEWRSGNDLLKWPMPPDEPHGSAFLSNYRLEDGLFHHGSLAIYPPHAANSSIQGLFGNPAQPETAGKQYMIQKPLYDLVVPTQCKFTTKMAFREDADTDGVTFSFGYIEPGLNLVWMKTANVKYDGNLKEFEVDLGALAGQKLKFLFKVEAGSSAQDDWFTLIDPMIISKEVQYQ